MNNFDSIERPEGAENQEFSLQFKESPIRE